MKTILLTAFLCFHLTASAEDDQAAALQEITKALMEAGITTGQVGDNTQINLDAMRKAVREAAEQGNATDQSVLGLIYISGEGVAQDFREAVTWARKAAEQGNAMGQVLLAACYYEGEGVPKDKVESYKWLLLAAGQGDGPGKEAIKKNAKAQIAIAEGELTMDQIAEGQRLARNFNLLKTPGVIVPSPMIMRDTNYQDSCLRAGQSLAVGAQRWGVGRCWRAAHR